MDLKFNKEELVNLEYSLAREVVGTNRAGGYFSTTIIGCNTRKQHGLLVCPIKEFNNENHILLSSMYDTVVQHNQEFNLGIYKHSYGYDPKGHKYIIDFESTINQCITYRVGGVILKKEFLLLHNREQMLIKYTLVEANSPTSLRLRPMLAFRHINALSVANQDVNEHISEVKNGISTSLYKGFPQLYLQTDKKSRFVSSPYWHRDIEYIKDQRKSDNYKEDLFSLGYFDIDIKKGESIIISASLIEEKKTSDLDKIFTKEKESRPIRNDFTDYLTYSARQFLLKKDDAIRVIAGFPWYGSQSRDTFVSLPGLSLAIENPQEAYKTILETLTHTLEKGLFPESIDRIPYNYKDVDTPLWFFWALQGYAKFASEKVIWKEHSENIKNILSSFKQGVHYFVQMHDNGLLWVSNDNIARTWMNSTIDGVPVVPRHGYIVEVNALWYNAICYALELAKIAKDKAFIEEWKDIPAKIEENFANIFSFDDYLADYVGENGKNGELRPNQIIATSLPYSPITDELKYNILKRVKRELLAAKGIRTLCPLDPKYRGVVKGSLSERDITAFNGATRIWLLGHYIETLLKLYGKSLVPDAEFILKMFHEDMQEHCIGSVPEMYDGDPPHKPRGALSQAWNVAELLRIDEIIKKYK